MKSSDGDRQVCVYVDLTNLVPKGRLHHLKRLRPSYNAGFPASPFLEMRRPPPSVHQVGGPDEGCTDAETQK